MFDTFLRKEELNQRKQLQCSDCRRATIHTLEAQCVGETKEDVGHGDTVYGGVEFSLYRCGACDAVCFEQSSWFSEDWDHDEEGNVILNRTEVQYPPPSSADFAFDTDYTPSDLDELIDEMIYALAGSKLKLATVALRMVVEFIVTDKNCAGGNLEKKINDLQAKGHVDQEQLDLLHTIRKKGNAGAHERIAMNRKEMVAGVSIINLLLEKLYNGPARQAAVIKKAKQAFKVADKQ
ncbi:DUF4145 domain-containing protein [Labrys neptuniae]